MTPEQRLQAGQLAAQMTCWLALPVPATTADLINDPTFCASADLINWARAARDLLAAVAAEAGEVATAAGTMTTAQWRELTQLYLALPVADKMRPIAELAGRDVADVSELSETEAAKVIDGLKEKLDA